MILLYVQRPLPAAPPRPRQSKLRERRVWPARASRRPRARSWRSTGLLAAMCTCSDHASQVMPGEAELAAWKSWKSRSATRSVRPWNGSAETCASQSQYATKMASIACLERRCSAWPRSWASRVLSVALRNRK